MSKFVNTVVQCSECGILSSISEFSKSIIGKKCGRELCDGTNVEILFEDARSQEHFTIYNNKRSLEDLKDTNSIKKKNKLIS